MSPSIIVGLMLLTGTSLAACNRTDGEDVLANDPFAGNTSARSENQLGKGFGKAFRADPNSEPANVAEGDLGPVSYTAEPVHLD